MDKLHPQYTLTIARTAGETATEILIRVVGIIRVHIELAIRRIPVRIDDASAVSLIAQHYP